MRTISFFLTAIFLLGVTGCGGDNAGGTPSPPSAATFREVPGYRIQVAASELLIAGTLAKFKIRVISLDGSPTPAAMHGWIASDYQGDAPGNAATATPGTTDGYTLDILLPPAFTTQTAVWIRLTQNDGSTLEAGNDSFLINEIEIK